nr:MAG TPA: hypothetical protein [Caudoviricetes sp.]
MQRLGAHLTDLGKRIAFDRAHTEITREAESPPPI